MFDMFEPSTDQLRESHLHHATNYLSLAKLLIEKGIITDDELDRSRTQAVHIVEQIFAQKREEANEQFDEDHPGVREFMEKLFGGP